MFKSLARGCLCMAAIGFALGVTAAASGADQQMRAKGRPDITRANIENALEVLTEIDAIEEPPQLVVEYLEAKHDIHIELDRRALDSEGITGDTRVTGSFKGVTLGSALDLLLRDLGLTYVIRNEVLLITTEKEADKHFETVVYPVGDLVANDDKNCDGQAYAQLVRAIEKTVAPKSWYTVGGQAAAAPIPVARALTIKQTQRAHREIEQLLSKIRDAMEHQKQISANSKKS